MTLEQTVLQCASPALCGIKSACLFSLSKKNPQKEISQIHKWNRELSSCGKTFVIIPRKEKPVLVFIYDKALIELTLNSKDALSYLKEKNYPVTKGSKALIAELIKRLYASNSEDFPHEIGLFLGYPLKDVIAFEKDNGKESKYTGAWQVYGNVQEACQTMQLYKECRDSCFKLLEKGMNITNITLNWLTLKNKMLDKEAC